MAPDELPPVTEPTVDLTPADVGDVDRRQYFSDLLQKLTAEGLKSTKLTNPQANLLADMKKYWKDKKKNDQISAMNNQLAQNLAPLQKLEQEWASLQDEIDQKTQLLREKEQKIQELAEQLKNLARKTESMSIVKK